jgi:putative endonuclease
MQPPLRMTKALTCLPAGDESTMRCLRTYYVYIMSSASRVLYIGVTNNVERRTIEHWEGRVPGFSAKYRTRELVYVEAFGHVRAAIAREKQLKGWLRARKIALIESQNPGWKDMAAGWRLSLVSNTWSRHFRENK